MLLIFFLNIFFSLFLSLAGLRLSNERVGCSVVFLQCNSLAYFVYDLCWLKMISRTIFHTSKQCIIYIFKSVDGSRVKINLCVHVYASCSGCDRTKKSSFLSFFNIFLFFRSLFLCVAVVCFAHHRVVKTWQETTFIPPFLSLSLAIDHINPTIDKARQLF